MKKHYLVFLVLVLLMTTTACGKTEKDTAPSSDLYAGSITDADQFIDIPALRQYGYYTCGTTCIQMIMNWLYPYDYDINLMTYEEEIGTTEEDGTNPDLFEAYFRSEEVDYERRENMTIEELVSSIDTGAPVIIALQAWGDKYNVDNPDDAETYLDAGHWIICVGYKDTDEGYLFYFNDPSCVGHCVMNQADLENRWIDMDRFGTVFNHFGFVIRGTTDYHKDGVFYLD